MPRSASARRLLLVLALILFSSGCRLAGGRPVSACERCHAGIEAASPSHGGCVDCHGGDGRAGDKEASHKGMLGPRNPSSPQVWEKGCGRCHPYQLARVRSGLMTTNIGMIRNIRATWDGGEDNVFAAAGASLFDPSGQPLDARSVGELPGLSGELYRKFCALCHVGAEPTRAFGSSHASGCAACHFPFNDNATYLGGDPTVRGKRGYSDNHAMSALPENRACLRCHNRSGRIAFSYTGLSDGNASQVPTLNGGPGPRMTSGGRSLAAIMPDIHFARGMDCIDCHTSRDVMGDGYAYPNLYRQVEVRCEDCHGGATTLPRYRDVVRENEEPVRESRNYPVKARPGMRMIVTGKGRSYSNVFVSGRKILVQGKRSGKLHESRVITGTPAHTVVGHERMACHACHSRTVIQCYGCHTAYDRTRKSYDFILRKETPGAFSETEDYRSLYPFPLAVDEQGRIAPVTPGCQTFVTTRDESGRATRQEYVAPYKGKAQFRFAPFFSHNTGDNAVTCVGCHADPAFLGFGSGVLAGGTFEGTLRCEKRDDRALDAILSLEDGRIRADAAVTRENGRPLSGAEVRRAFAVNLCLVCHDKAEDNVYRRRIDYRALRDAVHRPLLADR
jgi:hypothetical protein